MSSVISKNATGTVSCMSHLAHVQAPLKSIFASQLSEMKEQVLLFNLQSVAGGYLCKI